MIFRQAALDWRAEKWNSEREIVKRDEWAELHPDLLNEIVKHIPSYDDYVRIRAACKRWSIALPKIPRHIKGPWLVLPFDDEASKTHKIEAYHLTIRLPELQNTQIRGSCFGWLISVGIDGELRMLNPFSNSRSLLPSLSTFPCVVSYQPEKHGQEYTLRHVGGDKSIYTFDSIRMQRTYVLKIVLSSSPEKEDFMAVAIYGEYFKLAYYRAGDDKWTDVPTMNVKCGGFDDVIFHEGKIYAINWRIHLYEFDMKTLVGGITEVSLPSGYSILRHFQRRYLARSPDGHLLLVFRMVRSCFIRSEDSSIEQEKSYDTTRCSVCKLDESTKRWSELECQLLRWFEDFSLNYALIVGYNSSICKFADDEGDCARNCVYYTDNIYTDNGWLRRLDDEFYPINCVSYTDKKMRYGRDIGVFNLKDGKIKRLFTKSGTLCPPPVWVFNPS